MATWLTLKQVSGKYGIAKSTLQGWTTLGYLTFSTIDGILMLDEDSLVHYLDAHKIEGLSEESLDELIKSKRLERETVLSLLNDELVVLKTQSLHQPLFHVIIQELSELIVDDRQREIFLAISSGEPVSRVAARHKMTYEKPWRPIA